MKRKIGILAYGSLVSDPGDELGPLVHNKIPCLTPFNVEFARMSNSRGFAPTLIPIKSEGSPVRAVILVLSDIVSLKQAKDMLWRRETRKLKGSYQELKNPGVNTVQVKELNEFEGVSTVIYTEIGQNLALNSAPYLAHLAIESILSDAGEKKKDGIRYLRDAIANDIITPKSSEYEKFILQITKTKNLDEAIEKMDAKRPILQKQEKDLADFESQVTEISDLICDYGFSTTFQGIDQEKLSPETFENLKAEKAEAFLINCHDGFKKGQSKILKMMLDFEAQKRALETNLKLQRKNNEKAKSKETKNKISTIESRENILRHLIDTIVWQIFGGQLYISRLAFQGVDGTKKLTESNIDSAVKVAQEYNKIPTDFALITDLSGYIQIGDILLVQHGSIAFVEVKDGKKNIEHLELMKEIFEAENIEEAKKLISKKKWDKKSAMQMIRQFKQVKKASNVIDILRTDKGMNDGKEVRVATPYEDTPIFHDRLAKLYLRLNKSSASAYDNIEGCLHIGLYKGPLKIVGGSILKKLAEHQKGPVLVVDYKQVVMSLNRPLLLLPFPKQMLFDILFGRVYFYFALNIELYLSLFENYGLKAVWLSRKETMKALKGQKGHEAYLNNGQAVQISKVKEESKSLLGYGIFTKIFFEHILPSYTAYSFNYLLNEKNIESGSNESESNF